MRKACIPLAVAAVCAFPVAVQADDSTVSIYGSIKVLFESVEAKGATNPSENLPRRTRVSPATSHIGFRGSEPLGGGNNAFFQVESNAQPDTGGGTWASRNSGVGLNGPWGAVLLGLWDTPLKLSTGRLDPFGNDIGDASPMFRNTGIVGGNTTSSTDPAVIRAFRGSFHRRQFNTAQYWTPNLSGFSGRLMYGANEERSATANPSLWSGSVTYDNGPIFVTAAYELHKNYGGLGLDDKGWNVGAAYKIGGTQIGVGYARMEYELTGTGNCVVATSRCDTELNNWLVSLIHTMGPHTLRGYYQRSRDPDGDSIARVGGAGPASSGDGGARQWVIGYGYAASKRTELFAIYSSIRNDQFASYDFGTNAIVTNAGSNAPQGSDPRGFGVGIRHNF